jgi:pyocin large subunit-like protein
MPFRSAASAISHWGTHRHKFVVTPANAAAYEMMADAFFGPRPAAIAEGQRRGNGDIVRYDPITTHFGVIDNAGKIKTFYPAQPSVHHVGTNADYFIAEIQK